MNLAKLILIEPEAVLVPSRPALKPTQETGHEPTIETDTKPAEAPKPAEAAKPVEVEPAETKPAEAIDTKDQLTSSSIM